jgi:DNA mismatch repair protein MutS
MQNDRTTLRDLSVFPPDGSDGVFALLDRTTTRQGHLALMKHIQHPPDTFALLRDTQDAIRFLGRNLGSWPEVISNGTLVMLEKYFDSADSSAPPPSGLVLTITSFFQKVLNKQEYFFTRFSISHLADLLKGCMQLIAMADADDVPPLLKAELDLMKDELGHRLTQQVMNIRPETSYGTLTQLNYKARREMKNMVYRLMASYARLDAWQAMARATAAHGWVFPMLEPQHNVCFEARGLRHPLLQEPISYDVDLGNDRNFMLLTGANMSGKTTYMRAIGVAALLAHLGMGVPATAMRVSFLQGIITNMQVEDNILKGESYFFAEVQRMKQTASRLLEPRPHLVLMDELFKGTNVHDACECTRAVIEGLLRHPGHLMVLSTHLYEVAQHFSDDKAILFAYFVTTMGAGGKYEFTYELKPGISNDRIGYRILQQEGVIDILNTKRPDNAI